MQVYETKAKEALEKLSLMTALANLDTAAQRAAAENWSYTHFLGFVLEAEMGERHRRTVEMSLQFARFPVIKKLVDYDYKAQPGVDRRLVEELQTGRFLFEGRNLILLGPPGVGKTHLAIGLGVVTAELGHRVYFTSAIDLVRKLTKATAENRLSREMKNFTRPKLLIVDEVGYLQLEQAEASLLFQVISERYERQGAIILTSNKAFSNWGEVFAGDAVMASATLDRLLHRATVINIRGESYRMKEKLKAGKSTDIESLEKLQSQAV